MSENAHGYNTIKIMYSNAQVCNNIIVVTREHRWIINNNKGCYL